MDLIQIRQNETLLVLHGAGMATPFRGAIYRPDAAEKRGVQDMAQNLADDTAPVNSTIELALEGTPVRIEAGLARLGCLLEEALRWAHMPGGEHVYLEVRVTPGGDLWRSRLTGGCIQPIGGVDARGADSRALGRQAVRLVLERFDWWEGAETELALSNPGGAGVLGGLEISNCWDASRANYVDISAAAAAALAETCDLPTPLTLDFAGIDTDTTGTLYAFQNIYSSPAELAPVIEGEAGLTGSGVSGARINDPYCSGGQFQRLTWSGDSEVTVWTSSLLPETVRRCAGRPFLPLACLAYPLYPNESIWHHWRLTVSWSAPETVFDSPGCYLPITSALCPGVPLFLPPWPVAPTDTPAGMGIELRAQAAGAGSHQIDLDYLYLLPLDGWRIYRPMLTSWGGGLKLHDDPYQGTLRAGDWGIQMHTAEGPGLWLIPGRATRLYFLIERSLGGFLPGTRSRVRLFYRPRRRAL